MFKSAFSKFLVAFTVIIVVSFLLVSAIVNAVIFEHIDDENDAKLMNISSIVAGSISSHLEDGESASDEAAFREFYHILEVERDIMIIVTKEDSGSELVLYYCSSSDKVIRKPEPTKNPVLDFSDYETVKDEGGNEYKKRDEGKLADIVTVSSRYFAAEVAPHGEHFGYVVAVMSNEREDAAIAAARQATINGSLWVIFAAVIAAYFITERIAHPLRDMTNVVKSFSKGDFSQRVVVHGKDEVAELAAAFNNMAKSLENLEKMRSSFLASVSHDLRTPMTTISGFIDGINSGAIPPEKQEYYLGIISQEVKRLSRLVSQLLDVSRLESGDRKFEFADFDIAELSRIILISFESKIEEKKLDVSFETDEDSMMVKGDKDAIHQVMYNLCHNAMKFSREGGRFEIRIKYAPDKKVAISVFNEGQGIAASDIDMIFDRFYKTDTSRGLDKSGVGLGLYISKTIIDAHGEKISVNSVENENCEFTFTLKEGERQQRRRLDGLMEEV